MLLSFIFNYKTIKEDIVYNLIQFKYSLTGAESLLILFSNLIIWRYLPPKVSLPLMILGSITILSMLLLVKKLSDNLDLEENSRIKNKFILITTLYHLVISGVLLLLSISTINIIILIVYLFIHFLIVMLLIDSNLWKKYIDKIVEYTPPLDLIYLLLFFLYFSYIGSFLIETNKPQELVDFLSLVTILLVFISFFSYIDRLERISRLFNIEIPNTITGYYILFLGMLLVILIPNFIGVLIFTFLLITYYLTQKELEITKEIPIEKYIKDKRYLIADVIEKKDKSLVLQIKTNRLPFLPSLISTIYTMVIYLLLTI